MQRDCHYRQFHEYNLLDMLCDHVCDLHYDRENVCEKFRLNVYEDEHVFCLKILLFVNVKIAKAINIKPTTTSALIKKSSGIFNEKPAINNPIRIILDVCPIPHSAPLKEEKMVRFCKSSFFELVVLLLFFNS